MGFLHTRRYQLRSFLVVEASENDITLIMNVIWLCAWDSCSCEKLQGAHFPPTLSLLSYSCSLVWSYLCFGRVTDILILLFRHICSKKHNFFFCLCDSEEYKFSTEFLIWMFVRYKICHHIFTFLKNYASASNV